MDVEAYRHLGLQGLRSGDLEAAATCLRRALVLAPQSDAVQAAWCEMLGAGQTWDRLVAWADRWSALCLDPASRYHRALALLREGAYEEALTGLRTVAAMVPAEPSAWALIAEAEELGGRTDAARRGHDRTSALSPGDTAVLLALIAFLGRIGAGDTALTRFGPRLATLDTAVEVLTALIDMLIDRRRQHEAVSALLAMARRWPSHAGTADWLLKVAGLAMAQGDHATTLSAMRAVAALVPDHGPAWSNLSEAAREGAPETARAWARRSVAVNPLAPEAYGSLAMAQRALHHFDAVEASLRRALVAVPGYLSGLVNLSQLLLMDGRIGEAERHAWRAFALAPNDSRVARGLGKILLAGGKLDRGLSLEENRLVEPSDPPRVGVRILRPRWTGEPFRGRSLLIWPERGIGDQFYYARWLPMISTDSGKVIVECEGRLAGLYQRSFPDFAIVASRPSIEETLEGASVDLQIPVGSLPLIFQPEGEQAIAASRAGTPRPVHRYFTADPNGVRTWNAILSPRPGRLRVAISWRSGMLAAPRNHYYMTIDEFLPLFRDLPVTVVNVQYNSTSQEIDRLRDELPELYLPAIDLKNDLDDVAALVASCDLVIAPDTAITYMAAGLGVPTWCFLTGRDWLDGASDRHPLLPNLFHFTRRLNESWAVVIERLRAAMIKVLDGPQPVDTPPHLPHPR